MNGAAREREQREVNGGPRTREEWRSGRATETGLYLGAAGGIRMPTQKPGYNYPCAGDASPSKKLARPHQTTTSGVKDPPNTVLRRWASSGQITARTR